MKGRQITKTVDQGDVLELMPAEARALIAIARHYLIHHSIYIDGTLYYRQAVARDVIENLRLHEGF
ncbi:MAG: hypothetical protein V3V96_06600 [Acidiferrobacterales bacterium]